MSWKNSILIDLYGCISYGNTCCSLMAAPRRKGCWPIDTGGIFFQVTGKLDKTEKLLAIDFLLGGPGTTHELINKLCVDQNCSLSKEGIFRILGEVLAASPDNIKKDITRGIKEIRSGNNLSQKRIDQLINVKAIFNQSKLGLKAGEIDRLIDTLERPTVGIKNGVEYH